MGSGASKNNVSFRQRSQMIGVLQTHGKTKSVSSSPQSSGRSDSPSPSLILDNPDSRNPLVRETARKWYHSTQVKFENQCNEQGLCETQPLQLDEDNKYSNITNASATIMIKQLCKIRTNRLKIDDFKKITRRKAIEEKDNLSVDIPYEAEDKLESSAEVLCHICSVYTGSETFPCRICGNVFHESCLRKIGHIQDASAMAVLERAHLSIGWSCHQCESINHLLTEEEMSRLVETFDKYDVNKDSRISKEEFVKYRKAKHIEQHGTEFTNQDLKQLLDQFHVMDFSKSGYIEWWEFLNYESMKILQKRSQNALVQLLTSREVDVARYIFRLFDKDGTGHITTSDARCGFKTWYLQILKKVEDMKVRSGKKSVFGACNFLDDYSPDGSRLHTNEKGIVRWTEFVRGLALYILSSRPNNLNLYTGLHKCIDDTDEGTI